MRRKPRAAATSLKVTRLLKQLKHNGILPFKERPPVEEDEAVKKSGNPGASELFSLFTADIIKEDVVFTR